MIRELEEKKEMAGFVPSDPWTRRYLLISWMSEVEDIELKKPKRIMEKE